MKVILEFNLPEESEDFDLARKGVFLNGVILDLDNFLRTKTKYEDKDTILVQEVRDKLWELMNA